MEDGSSRTTMLNMPKNRLVLLKKKRFRDDCSPHWNEKLCTHLKHSLFPVGTCRSYAALTLDLRSFQVRTIEKIPCFFPYFWCDHHEDVVRNLRHNVYYC